MEPKEPTNQKIIQDSSLDESSNIVQINLGSQLNTLSQKLEKNSNTFSHKDLSDSSSHTQKNPPKNEIPSLSKQDKNRCHKIISELKKSKRLIAPFLNDPLKVIATEYERNYYLSEIVCPMFVKKVLENVDKNPNFTLDDFIRDCKLIFKNAMHYNRDDSSIFRYAFSCRMKFAGFFEKIFEGRTINIDEDDFDRLGELVEQERKVKEQRELERKQKQAQKGEKQLLQNKRKSDCEVSEDSYSLRSRRRKEDEESVASVVSRASRVSRTSKRANAANKKEEPPKQEEKTIKAINIQIRKDENVNVSSGDVKEEKKEEKNSEPQKLETTETVENKKKRRNSELINILSDLDQTTKDLVKNNIRETRTRTKYKNEYFQKFEERCEKAKQEREEKKKQKKEKEKELKEQLKKEKQLKEKAKKEKEKNKKDNGKKSREASKCRKTTIDKRYASVPRKNGTMHLPKDTKNYEPLQKNEPDRRVTRSSMSRMSHREPTKYSKDNEDLVKFLDGLQKKKEKKAENLAKEKNETLQKHSQKEKSAKKIDKKTKRKPKKNTNKATTKSINKEEPPENDEDVDVYSQFEPENLERKLRKNCSDDDVLPYEIIKQLCDRIDLCEVNFWDELLDFIISLRPNDCIVCPEVIDGKPVTTKHIDLTVYTWKDYDKIDAFMLEGLSKGAFDDYICGKSI